MRGNDFLCPKVLVWLAAAASCLSAQTASGRRVFDVASVKPVDRGCVQKGLARFQTSSGRIVLGCITVRALIQTAYNEMRDGSPVVRTTGGPSWIDSLTFSVEAKAEGATPVEMLGPMLQDLLKERFHVEIHKEPRETPVYLLIRGDREPRLKAADSDACTVRDMSNPLAPPPTSDKNPHRIFCGSATRYGNPETANLDSRSVTLESFAVFISIPSRTGL